jgi:hypothetical protein
MVAAIARLEPWLWDKNAAKKSTGKIVFQYKTVFRKLNRRNSQKGHIKTYFKKLTVRR